MAETMPAITLWQPWASLIAVGAKRIETRSWPAPERYIGQRIAIHAARKFESDEQRLCLQVPFWEALHVHYAAPGELPTGAVVATATMAGCVPTEEVMAHSGLAFHPGSGSTPAYLWIPWAERQFGDYSPGRYAWVLEDILRLATPIPARGAQGIWQWQPPEGVEL